jgi:hypothetical protein
MKDDVTTLKADDGIIMYERSNVDTEIRTDTVLSTEDMR